MAAKKKAKKVSIPMKDMMKAIDENDFDFYSRLDAAHKKAFSPWITMRCASSASSSAAYHYLLHVNDIVNVDFSLLKKHPELQWKLLATCGQGSATYHPWLAPAKGKTKSKLHKFLLSMHPNLNTDELNLLLAMNDKDDITELAQMNGYSDKEIKELFK